MTLIPALMAADIFSTDFADYADSRIFDNLPNLPNLRMLLF